MEGNTKEAKKSILPIIAGIAAIVAVVGVVWLIIRGGNRGDSSDTSSVAEVVDATKVTAADLAADKVSEIVEFGDYTAMFVLSKAIQNGERIGAVVTVDGVVSRTPTSYSIGQNNPDKSETEVDYFGTVFTIQDGAEADYPEDEQRAKITAKVMEVSPLNFQLVTLKDFVEKK